MKPIWQLDGDDVIRLQSNSTEFVRFVNALLAVQARAGGLQDAHIRLNQKDTEPDGGVDAAIDRAVPIQPDPTGRLGVPTCWQFKACPSEHIKAKVKKGQRGGQEVALRQEVDKPHSRQLILQGYGYRYCITVDMPPVKKGKWEKWLLTAVRKINPTAPPPQVLTATDLALWANRYPALVIQFRQQLQGSFDCLEVWHREIRALTQTFVPVASWTPTAEVIRRHVDFSQSVTSILTVQGEAGVGKTRSVCEALVGDLARQSLVVATSDEQNAIEFAKIIARDQQTQAILVADECSLDIRERLRQVVPACANRLRVIAIDNSLQRAGSASEIRLEHLQASEVETILERNFAHLPADRRRYFADMTRGFVRLAVDLCDNNHLVPANGQMDSIFGFFHDRYLRKRLTDIDLKAIELISLLRRVGYRDDVRGELDLLCKHPLIHLEATDIVQVATRLKQSPGFIAFAGRYLYVTPKLIAAVVFEAAWNRWIAPDPDRFLSSLAPELLDRFIERVQSDGTTQMKETVSAFFFDWAHSLDPQALSRKDAVVRLVQLVEVQPARFLPIIGRLLARASLEELRQFHANGYEGHEARRQLVWLAEKLARFPEFFADVEVVLLRLALAETESQLSNSASRIWAALFRISLSGTSTPFHERLSLFERRVREADATQLRLVLAALAEIIGDGPDSRLAVPPVVCGRVPPPHWHPETLGELRACHRAALAMVSRLAEVGGSVADDIRAIVVRSLSYLLWAGYLDEVRAALGPPPWPDALLASLLRELEQFLDVHFRSDRIAVDGTAQPELETKVLDWYRSLVPNDIHGRLVSVVGQEPWHQQLPGEQATWQQAVDDLAKELLQSPSTLERELAWLVSPEARSAFRLGESLCQADSGGILLDRILSRIPIAGGTLLARGYLERLVTTHPELLGRANNLLDQLQVEAPRVAYDVIWAAGDEVRKVERLFRMIDAGGLSADFLRDVEFGVRGRPLRPDEFHGALQRLMSAAESGNDRAASVAVHLLYRWLHHGSSQPNGEKPRPDCLRQDDRVRAVFPRILELAFGGLGRVAEFWVKLVADWAVIDPESAVRLLLRAQGNGDFQTRTLAENRLVDLAQAHPAVVMQCLGEVALDSTYAWHFPVRGITRLLDALPEVAVHEWLLKAGVVGARRLARHLAPPHLDNTGLPIVPPLTAFILEQFEKDDEVFDEFCAGTHSSRVYNGDAATKHEQEAGIAHQFLSHPLKRVREWASAEIEFTRWVTEAWRDRREEVVLP